MVEYDNGRKQNQIGENKKQLEAEEYEIRRLKEEAEKVIEMERAARSRIRRPRPAEMSIQTINAAVKWNAITTSATYAAVTARTRSNLRNFGDHKYKTQYLSTHNRRIAYNPYA